MSLEMRLESCARIMGTVAPADLISTTLLDISSRLGRTGGEISHLQSSSEKGNESMANGQDSGGGTAE